MAMQQKISEATYEAIALTEPDTQWELYDGQLRERPGMSYEHGRPFRGQPGKLLVLSDPLPLVVEVWSSSTGNYAIDAKLPMYTQRGDDEIWYTHPYERTLTAWRRQPDGTYEVATYREGVIRPVALPDVMIDLDDLFEVEHRTTDD